MKHWTNPGALIALLLLFASSSLLRAQGVDEAHANSLAAMTEARRLGSPAGDAKWMEALELLTQVTDDFDERALNLFGGKFGWFWYHRGFCELRLKKFDEAISSFKHCYEKYPNEKGDKDGNAYNKRSLLKWGEAAQGLEDYQTAIDQFKKFLDERDPQTDDFPKGAFYTNMALCHFKVGKLAGGNENLQIAIKNKDSFPTPPAAIMAGFQALCEAAIEKGDEAIMLDFLKKHRADITFLPWQAQPYSPVFMSLAAKALGAELKRTAFELYSLVPDTVEAEDSIAAARQGLGDFKRPIPDGATIYNKAALDKQLEMSRARGIDGNLPEITALAATAFIHEKNGNVRGAYAAYQMLEDYYSDGPKEKREGYLYHLVRTASQLGRVTQTEQDGNKFLRLFPDSEHAESVSNLLLTGLFFDGRYESCLKVAETREPELEKSAKGSEQQDICLHVLGGSYFYTGRFDKAVEPLERHRKEFPESQFKVAAQYFQASNFAQLQIWDKAGAHLDKFLQDHPNPKENVYLPFALFDRANTHFAQEENEKALEKLDRIENEFPDASNRELVFNLKGNLLQIDGKSEEAKVYYTKALALAEEKDNGTSAGESLYHLINLFNEEGGESLKEAIPAYEKFWENYGDESPYKGQVAIAGMPALIEAGRAQDGLDRMKKVIAQLAKVPGAYGLEQAINSYTKFFLETPGKDDEMLKDEYYNFEGITKNDKTAQALLRINLIGVFEEKAKEALKEQDDDKASRANASVKVLFNDLKKDFDLKNLSNFILVSLGDYLREKTGSPKEAIPYYEEVLDRTNQQFRFEARFGLADVFGRSASPAENSKAVEQLIAVYANSKKSDQKEQALYRAVQVLGKLERWEDAKKRAKEFLDPDLNFNRYAPYVSYVLAQAYDNTGEEDEAIISYFGVYSSYRGLLAVSAPSLKRYMEIIWSRNNPKTEKNAGDRQFAYETGHKFIKATANILQNDRVPEEEKEIWKEVRELTQLYEANPDTTPIVEEKEQ